MTPEQLHAMNIELWQYIATIADNESLMRRLTHYAKRLAKEKLNQSDQHGIHNEK